MNAKESNDPYQELFEHMNDEHDLILVDSEIQDIINIVNKLSTPSDEEINKEALEYAEQNKWKEGKEHPASYHGYCAGSKRMREKLTKK